MAHIAAGILLRSRHGADLDFHAIHIAVNFRFFTSQLGYISLFAFEFIDLVPNDQGIA